MECFYHPYEFGDVLLSARKEKNMTQIEFYRFLFPEKNLSEENIKKKMNALENGKVKNPNINFMYRFCSKCNISFDYLMGLKNNYKNHENEFISTYTGLNEKSIQTLHKLQIEANLTRQNEKNIKEPNIDDIFKKEEAKRLLKIINLLLLDNNNKKDNFSTFSILYALNLLCINQPQKIVGSQLYEDFDYDYMNPNEKTYLEPMCKIDAQKQIYMADSTDTYYLLHIDDIYKQIAKNKLDKAIEKLINYMKKNT